MTPPTTLNVIDRHGGFTALVPTRNWSSGKMDGNPGTLWRPGAILRHTTVGDRHSFTETSVYQRNNDVTMAYYKVPGYRYLVATWFDNATGERIA